MTNVSEGSTQENPAVKDSEIISSGPLSIALVSIRNTEAYLRWQGAQWSIALNVSGLVALLYRLISSPGMPELFVLSFCCGIAAALDIEWYSVLRRDGRLFDFWSRKFAEHERRNGIRGGMELFMSAEYARLSSSRDRLQRKLERITVVFIGVWATATVVFFTLACVALKGGA